MNTSTAVPGPLLKVQNLHVSFPAPNGIIDRVKDISFDVHRGEVVGVVGESGSGKTLTALAIAQLLPRGAVMRATQMEFDGHDLLSESERSLRPMLGTEMAMVFQDPLLSLNPARRIGAQMVEAVREHQGMSRSSARDLARSSLESVHMTEPSLRLRQYPHELSGGMRQRTMIAMGLMSEPSLIIADEPTTALDVTVQAQVMQLLHELNVEHGSAILLISHNIALLSEVCDRLLVMYRGDLVETLSVEQLLEAPKHPYTRALMAAIPGPGTDRTKPLPIVADAMIDATEPEHTGGMSSSSSTTNGPDARPNQMGHGPC